MDPCSWWNWRPSTIILVAQGTPSVEIIQISKITSEHKVQLSRILMEAVHGSASVGFMLPFSLKDADNYWSMIDSNLNNHHFLWVAIENNSIIATVQLILTQSLNGQHRAEVVKLLVASGFRGQKVATKIMTTLEEQASKQGITLLLLDTQTGSKAETIYQHLGWQKIGEIPNYAKNPNGVLCSTSYFYKLISS